MARTESSWENASTWVMEFGTASRERTSIPCTSPDSTFLLSSDIWRNTLSLTPALFLFFRLISVTYPIPDSWEIWFSEAFSRDNNSPSSSRAFVTFGGVFTTA